MDFKKYYIFEKEIIQSRTLKKMIFVFPADKQPNLVETMNVKIYTWFHSSIKTHLYNYGIENKSISV